MNMRLTAVSLTIALVAISLASVLYALEPASEADKVFVGKVSQGGMYEVEASKVARQMATAPDVKDLAVMEVHDHDLVNRELKKIATGKGIPFSSNLMVHQWTSRLETKRLRLPRRCWSSSGMHRSHQRGKNEVYASSFTPKSAAKVREWLASMESRRKLTKQPPQISSSLGSVKFVLNADPVFLVFEAPTPGNGWTSENLTYSYVLYERSAYKIGNFAYVTELDDFLQDPKFFDKQFLKAAPTRPQIP